MKRLPFYAALCALLALSACVVGGPYRGGGYGDGYNPGYSHERVYEGNRDYGRRVWHDDHR